jgi:hypothetical protein
VQRDPDEGKENPLCLWECDMFDHRKMNEDDELELRLRNMIVRVDGEVVPDFLLRLARRLQKKLDHRTL